MISAVRTLMDGPPELRGSAEPDRDDRTLRTLAGLIDPRSVDFAMTHFVKADVALVIASDLLNSRNGWAAATLGLNMLTRFIGLVELRVVGTPDGELSARIDKAIEDLRGIDTRVGHSLTWIVGTEGLDVATVLSIGETATGTVQDQQRASRSTGARSQRVIALGFTSWTCQLILTPAGEGPVATKSEVAFGACAAVCFGVAEVFKSLLISCVESERAPILERRLTKSWGYSVWRQDRIDIGVTVQDGPDNLPDTTLEGVVQIGAGAVGNATIFTLAASPSIKGTLPVLDLKTVDWKNLNRCVYFRETDVNSLKVSVVSRASREDLAIDGISQPYTPGHAEGAGILLSTVDNNEVRHQMQETLPRYIVEGSTGDTRLAVSVHTAVDGRTCLICKHPERSLGVERTVPLTIAEAASRTGLSESVIRTGIADGSTEITDGLIAVVREHSPEMALLLAEARDEGNDLCGALGSLRERFGLTDGPREASIPFVSVLAGVLAASEVVKLRLRADGCLEVPVLDNMVEFDLARDYSRPAHPSALYPAHTDCVFCQERADDVQSVYAAKHGQLGTVASVRQQDE